MSSGQVAEIRILPSLWQRLSNAIFTICWRAGNRLSVGKRSTKLPCRVPWSTCPGQLTSENVERWFIYSSDSEKSRSDGPDRAIIGQSGKMRKDVGRRTCGNSIMGSNGGSEWKRFSPPHFTSLPICRPMRCVDFSESLLYFVNENVPYDEVHLILL